ncbi:uncharacterized protein J3D65DRAFT_159964 [Phyllosticta citribraziliensis]|uniref:Uncharacterized protein n=1 Tax=Phyllosticta citribraziliensis TaxID=989973 RepID=A0ABR1L843_9PEZI
MFFTNFFSFSNFLQRRRPFVPPPSSARHNLFRSAHGSDPAPGVPYSESYPGRQSYDSTDKRRVDRVQPITSDVPDTIGARPRASPPREVALSARLPACDVRLCRTSHTNAPDSRFCLRLFGDVVRCKLWGPGQADHGQGLPSSSAVCAWPTPEGALVILQLDPRSGRVSRLVDGVALQVPPQRRPVPCYQPIKEREGGFPDVAVGSWRRHDGRTHGEMRYCTA